MAYVIPVRHPGRERGRGPQLLLIILTKDNLERMREGDSFDLQTRAYTQLDPNGKVGDLDIVVAYEEDEALILELAKKGGIADIIAHIERGRVQDRGRCSAGLAAGEAGIN